MKLYLLSGVALAVGVLASLYLIVALKDADAAYGSLLRNQVRQADSARLMQLTFKKQVQAWKDVLLRGHDPKSLKKYSEEFRTEASKVNEMGTALRAEVQDADVRALIQEFLAAHATLGSKYDAALQAFTQTNGLNPKEVDKRVEGQDRAAADMVDQIVSAMVKHSASVAASQLQRSAATIWTATIVLLAAFLGIDRGRIDSCHP